MTRHLLWAVTVTTMLLHVPIVYGFGLGDLVQEINAKYGGSIPVDKQDCYGNPPRVGALYFDTKGLFGSPPNMRPLASQFFPGIRDLIPSDAKLTASYIRKSNYIKELYVFKSEQLKQKPGIKTAPRYQKELWNNPVGTFFMIVNYDVDKTGRVVNSLISLGLPAEVEFSNMKKMSKNPFK